MITISILLGLSVVINLVLIYGLFNLVKKNEAIEDLMIDSISNAKEHIGNALLVMQQLDIRGSFEKDDEVGVAFDEIKKTVEELYEKF